MIKKIIKLLFILCLFTKMQAQTIVNTEKLFLNEKPGFNLSGKLSGSALAGNSQLFSVNYSLNSSYLRNKNAFKFFSGGKYVRQSKVTSANNLFGQIRYEYNMTPRRRFMLYYQLQYNQILLLTRRQLLGTGLRQNLIQLQKDSISDFKFDVSLGFMQEEEILNRSTLPPSEMYYTNYTRGVFSAMMRYNIYNRFKLVNTTYYEPYFRDFSDYRFLNDLNLFFNITKKIASTFELEYRYDSKPPSTLRTWDINLSFGFIMEI